MERILTSKAYALVVCTLIAAALSKVTVTMAATTEPKEAKLTQLMSDAPD
jgi:hypothetical protein